MKHLTPIDLNQNELRNAVVQVLASDPVSPVNGQIWINSTSWTLKIRLNGSTIAIGRLDQITNPSASVSLASQRITDLATPIDDADAATKAWVLSQILPRDHKESVRVSPDVNVTISAPGATLDGVSMISGDRVLLRAQTTPAENGIWVWNGSASAMTRASDADGAGDLTTGSYVAIEEGTNALRRYVLATTNPITIGTTAQTWNLDSASGTVNSYSETIGDGSTTQFTITHNFNTEDVTAVVREASGSKEAVVVDWRVTGSNTIRVDFATAPASNAYRVTVLA